MGVAFPGSPGTGVATALLALLLYSLASVLEPALPPLGELKTWRKGVGLYKVRVTGVAAHAGAAHNEGVNAIEAWLGSIPGQTYANVRQPPISTLNLAHMMPLSAVWAGPRT